MSASKSNKPAATKSAAAKPASKSVLGDMLNALANDPAMIPPEVRAPAAAAPAAADPLAALGSKTVSAVIGAKQHIRALLSAPGASLSLADLCKASGKTEVNVRTMLSDLRSPKYAGKQGVFVTISTRGADGITRYSVPVAPAAAPASDAAKQ